MRKHHTQMTRDEHSLLLTVIRARAFKPLPHALDRMTEKNVTGAQIAAMMTYCSVVEIHDDALSELRVLVRGKVRGDFVCAVLSLTNNTVVTTYWNRAGDHHATLDRSVYAWSVDVRDALRQFNCE